MQYMLSSDQDGHHFIKTFKNLLLQNQINPEA